VRGVLAAGCVVRPDSRFRPQVAPVLAARCLACHNNQLDNAGISFENRETVLPKLDRIVPAIGYQGEFKMPPGKKLNRPDIAILTAWVRDGAPWGTKLLGVKTDARQFPFEIWTFDRLQNIGGYATKIEGHPHLIDAPVGKAVEFNAAGDALFIDGQPLADAASFTWEVIFRPDKDGGAEQRFFQLQERDPHTGQDTANRFLFEIRIAGGQWFLDTYVMSRTGSKTLFNRPDPHPLGQWYHAAQVYDGRTYRNYVNGILENQGELNFTPNGAGHSSVGVRINRRDYFKGAIAKARFTRSALSPAEFLSAK
jgi:hypothetical protein